MTLFHWDSPQALEDAGGWPARDTVDAFAEYVEVGRRRASAIASALDHAQRALGRRRGSATAGATTRPAATDADALATAITCSCRTARRSRSCGTTPRAAGRHHAQPRPPVCRVRLRRGPQRRRAGSTAFATGGSSTRSSAAHYPEDMAEAWARSCPRSSEGDLETISAPIDFLGVNNYTSPLVAADDNGGAPQIVRRDVDRTDMGWEVYPEGLADLLVRVASRLRAAAIYITENGAAYADVREHDGRVNDRSGGLPEVTSPPSRARSRRRSAPRATSPGRSSTTSSGHRATRSASASSTSTTPPLSGAEGELLLVPRLHRGAAPGHRRDRRSRLTGAGGGANRGGPPLPALVSSLRRRSAPASSEGVSGRVAKPASIPSVVGSAPARARRRGSFSSWNACCIVDGEERSAEHPSPNSSLA